MDSEIMKVRDQQWAALIQDRINSGLTVDEWCHQQNIGKYAYYYHLKKLRRQALAEIHAPEQKAVSPDTGFVAIPDAVSNNQPDSTDDTTLRITKNDLVIELSNNASEGILSLLREVLTHAS